MKASVAVALSVLVVSQQQPPAPATTARAAAEAAIAQAAEPADCVKALQAFVSKRQQEVRPPSGYTAEILRKVDDERATLASACVTKFERAKTPSQLAGLAELYIQANVPDRTRSSEPAVPDRARATLAAALAADATPAERAAVLTTAITMGLREPKGDERNARLEKLLDELDADPAASLEQKWTAHSRMEGYYRGDDIDAGIIKHARWMADAARSFSPEQRKQYGMSVVQSQINMAEALAGQALNDEALALLRRTADEWRESLSNRADLAIKPVLERYSLVGTPAAALKAAHWLNAAPGTTDMAMTGMVTLLEFTAHWCGPCRESYPGVNRLRRQFGPQGFRVVMATRYYGYFSNDGKTERDLSNEDEYKRDVQYFAGYQLDVPVAIADLVSVKVVDGKVTYTPGPDPNETAYKVSGIPQIHLIDRRGRIRLIMIGYDEANEPKLAETIAKLLAEGS